MRTRARTRRIRCSPLVERVRDRMLAADRDLRLLLAYAREFAEPRPYRLPQAGATVSTARSLHGSPPPGRRRTTASGARASRRRARHANCSGRCCRRRAGSHRSGRCQSVRGPCLTDSPVSYKPSSTMAPPSATRSRTCGTSRGTGRTRRWHWAQRQALHKPSSLVPEQGAGQKHATADTGNRLDAAIEGVSLGCLSCRSADETSTVRSSGA